MTDAPRLTYDESTIGRTTSNLRSRLRNGVRTFEQFQKVRRARDEPVFIVDEGLVSGLINFFKELYSAIEETRDQLIIRAAIQERRERARKIVSYYQVLIEEDLGRELGREKR